MLQWSSRYNDYRMSLSGIEFSIHAYWTIEHLIINPVHLYLREVSHHFFKTAARAVSKSIQPWFNDGRAELWSQYLICLKRVTDVAPSQSKFIFCGIWWRALSVEIKLIPLVAQNIQLYSLTSNRDPNWGLRFSSRNDGFVSHLC